MLTIDQVHQNNIAAKKILVALIDERKKKSSDKLNYKEKRKLLDKLIFENKNKKKTELIFYWISSKYKSMMLFIYSKTDARTTYLKILENELKLYFRYHYMDAGCLSKFLAPEMKISIYQSGLVFTTERKITIAKTPFPTN